MSERSWRHDGNRALLPLIVLPPDARDMRSIDAIALVDTGATTSAVTPDIAAGLSLPLVGKRPVSSVHGDALVPRYMFRIGILPTAAPDAVVANPSYSRR